MGKFNGISKCTTRQSIYLFQSRCTIRL